MEARSYRLSVIGGVVMLSGIVVTATVLYLEAKFATTYICSAGSLCHEEFSNGLPSKIWAVAVAAGVCGFFGLSLWSIREGERLQAILDRDHPGALTFAKRQLFIGIGITVVMIGMSLIPLLH